MGTRQSARVVPRSGASLIVPLLSALLVVLTACGSGDTVPVADDIAGVFDTQGSNIAVLGESTTEAVPLADLEQVVERARQAGTELRIVVSGDARALADAEPIADAYGGTALTYKAGDLSFKAASDDLDDDQLTRAAASAASENGLGASASAFVSVLENEGLQSKSSGIGRILLWVLLAVAALFMLSQLFAFRKARRRAQRRTREFDQRKASLTEWVGLVSADVDRLVSSQNRLGTDARRTLDATGSQVSAARTAVADATTLADLDANEIRVARAAMKVRGLLAQLR